jgi:hypothetical protein
MNAMPTTPSEGLPELPVVAHVWKDIAAGPTGAIVKRIAFERPCHIRREDLTPLTDHATATQELLTANERIAELEAALRELVAVKELRDAFDALNARNHPDEPPLSRMSDAEIERWRSMRDEYRRRKPLAWEAARKVLNPDSVHPARLSTRKSAP